MKKAVILSVLIHAVLLLPWLTLERFSMLRTENKLFYVVSARKPLASSSARHSSTDGPPVRNRTQEERVQLTDDDSKHQSTTIAAIKDAYVREALGANPPPEYPLRARFQRIEGKVLIKVVLRASSDSGAASEITYMEVASSSGSPLLDQSTLEAVKNWRFPPLPDETGQPELILMLPFEFSLHQ